MCRCLNICTKISSFYYTTKFFGYIYNKIVEMIKQTWNIDEDERNRILNLHESATKNLYLIKEQQQVKIGEKTTTTNKNFELDKKSFPAGFYSINKLGEGKKDLDAKLQEIAQFAQENNGSQVNIQIEVGESKVTNFDNELKKPLSQGELAKLRGQKLQEYLTNYFQGLVESKYLTTMPNIPTPQTNVELGTQKHNYIRNTDNPKDPKYLEDQYVKFIITLSATKKEDVYGCLVDLTIDVSYYDKEDDAFPCRGGHTCNNAKFEVFLDSVSLGIADLNNAGCRGGYKKGPNSCDRTAKLTVTNEMVQKIISNPKWNQKTLILSTRCISSGNCHTSVQEVKIVNGAGVVVYHGCVNPQSGRGNTSQKILAVLDKCGKPIEGSIDDNVTAEDVKALSDGVKSQDNNKILKIANTEGLNSGPNLGINIGIVTNDWYELTDLKMGNNLLTGTFKIKKTAFYGAFVNPLGTGRNHNFKFNVGDTIKINYPVMTAGVPQNKLDKFISKKLMYKIENFDGYFVMTEFKYDGNTYPSGIVITPTTEQ